MNIIDNVVKEAKWVQSDDWREKIVEHKTPSGQTRKVKVKSLSSEEQEKYKPKKKKVLDKVLNVVKNWKEENKKFFQGGQEPNSEARKGFGSFIKRKAKGLVQSIKTEISNWKVAAVAVKKIFKKEKLSKEDKKAMVSVAKHIVITAAGTALTGGISSASAPMAAMAKHLGARLLRSTALAAAKRSLLFAGEITDERALEIFIHDMANAVQNADLSEDDWIEAAKLTDL